MMKHHEAFAILRNVLAKLYDDETSARRVCRDAGLDILRIGFSTHAVNNWTAILNAAEKQAAITAILQIAQKEYAHYQPLHDAIEAYADAWVTDSETPGARATELAYLAQAVKDFEVWAERYTRLAGTVEVPAASPASPQPDLLSGFKNTPLEKLVERGSGPEQRIERVPVDDLQDAVRDERRLVLLGEPGAGKTTTLQRLLYDYALAAQSDPQAPLPLLVSLGGYSSNETPLVYAQRQFGVLGPCLRAYLHQKRVALLLDGLNEMPLHGYRERVDRIQAMLDDFPEVVVVVTCRKQDYVETLNLQKLEVKPLDPPRQLEYVRNYLGPTEGERLFWQMADTEVAGLWEVWCAAGASSKEFWTAEKMPDAVYQRTNQTQDRLWQELRRGELPPLWVLGGNPLVLGVIALVYALGGGALPANRARLFAIYVDKLLAHEFRRHDAVQWPGAWVLQHCLAQLAFAMQQAGERGTAVEEDWAVAQLAPHTADPAQILYLAASATLLDRGRRQVRFVHQLVQEYFAARALETELPASDFCIYWPNDWTNPNGWEETMVLLAGLLPDVKPLVEQLLPVHPVLAARVIAESGATRPPADTIRAVLNALVTIATGTTEPVRARSLAGDALNLLADPREGVGLTSAGLPDIAWCDVPAGPFTMGNTQETDRLALPDEAPQHEEPILMGYRISRYPITNAQYDAFVHDGGYSERWQHCWTLDGWRWKGNKMGPGKRGGEFDLANHPVVLVSWYEAYAFCRWLSEKTGLVVSLPTEAQWEKAARSTDGRRYPWGSEITPDQANWVEAGIGTTSAVGVFPSGVSSYGVFDMSGNVWEWCQTRWRDNYTTPADDRPQGEAGRMPRGGSFASYEGSVHPQSGPWRVVRGGSFSSNKGSVRCAVRRYLPLTRYDLTGFRVCAVERQG